MAIVDHLNLCQISKCFMRCAILQTGKCCIYSSKNVLPQHKDTVNKLTYIWAHTASHNIRQNLPHFQYLAQCVDQTTVVKLLFFHSVTGISESLISSYWNYGTRNLHWNLFQELQETWQRSVLYVWIQDYHCCCWLILYILYKKCVSLTYVIFSP